MYLRDIVSTLLRRWYLTVLALFLAVSAVALTLHVVGPTYQSKGSVVLVPPVDPESPQSNRLLGLGGLGQARDVLIRSLNSDTLHGELAEQYPGATYEIAPDYTTSAPVVLFTIEADGPATAADLRKDLVARVAPTLRELQTELDIPQASQVVSLVVNAGDEPTTLQKKRVRLALVAVAGVLVLSLGLIMLADVLLLRRRRTRSTESDGDAPISPDTPRANGTVRSSVRETTPLPVGADDSRTLSEPVRTGTSGPVLRPGRRSPSAVTGRSVPVKRKGRSAR